MARVPVPAPLRSMPGIQPLALFPGRGLLFALQERGSWRAVIFKIIRSNGYVTNSYR
jgi:hypothetical protein